MCVLLTVMRTSAILLNSVSSEQAEYCLLSLCSVLLHECSPTDCTCWLNNSNNNNNNNNNVSHMFAVVDHRRMPEVSSLLYANRHHVDSQGIRLLTTLSPGLSLPTVCLQSARFQLFVFNEFFETHGTLSRVKNNNNNTGYTLQDAVI